ncbi:MAG: carbonate dehydratase [Chloroflexales bacterium]|nr:carbonate dehydratase [Chloroflexales bacterium]
MSDVTQLLANNQAWAARMTTKDAAFFQRLESQQAPDYFWIGCSDSRVPATQLVGLLPGEMFVHRNVANVVVHSDLNCLAALHFAVDVLRVRHVIVCGHYGCGGVAAALHNQSFGLLDNWLRHVQDVRNKHIALLSACRDAAHQLRRLCELNVLEQVVNVCQTTIVQGAWQREQPLAVHGWIYGLGDGIVRDLAITTARPDEVAPQFTHALQQSAKR